MNDTTKPTIIIYDAITDTAITREMTNDEIAAILNPLPDYLPKEITE